MLTEQYSDYTAPFESYSNMSYPNMLTPPSSSEDSPQSTYCVASPNSVKFENYEYSAPLPYTISHSNVVVDPSVTLIKSEESKISLRFVEQPTDRFRFRYKSEMAGTHGSLTGINSDKSRKPTYPTVELKNCSNKVGTVIVRCSIYQSNANGKDFLPHAHRLIMKKGKEEYDDPHDLVVGAEEGYKAVFQGMGIIHTAKKNIVTELLRKKMQLKQEYVARTDGKARELTQKEMIEIKGLAESESKSINLNIVCLRFDAFFKDNGILYPICEPVFSHGINNLKSALTGDLKIVRLDHVVSHAKGNKEIFILVERVTKKNIKIRFYELDDDDNVVWEDWGKFNDLDVHHQYAIVFKTPPYRDENITSPVNVFIELVRPSDRARSEAREFRYIPNKNIVKPGQKRARYDYSTSSFESSNMGSEELPVVINNLQIEQNSNNVQSNILNNVHSGLSEEILKAINNIDSDEFRRIYSDHGEDYISYIETMEADASHSPTVVKVPKRRTKMVDENLSSIKMEVSKDERLMAIRVIDELKSFIETKHQTHSAIQILTHYFGEDRRTNALHVFICQKDNESVLLILKMIACYRVFNLLESRNNNDQTALHLAVLCHNDYIVNALLLCRAKVSTLDSELNTSLHLAVKVTARIQILELLLADRECESASKYINMENADGNTALVMAVDRKHLAVIKLLCLKNADVNKPHPKNGFVPLRFAIEKQYVDIVRYLLSLKHVNPSIRDFTNMSPLVAAITKPASPEITEVVQKYMSLNHIILDVKDEVEEETEEEMDDEIEIKQELPHLSNEEMEKLYEVVRTFTPQCLDEISAILDKSGNWRYISELLHIEHLVDSGIIRSDLSMSRAVLTYAVETDNDSIWMIRNFLENLDEHKAVEIIDRMVRDMKNC